MKHIYQIIVFALACAAMASCKSTKQVEVVTITDSIYIQTVDSVVIYKTETEVIVEVDSSKITYYREDGSVQAVSQTWKHASTHKQAEEKQEEVKAEVQEVKQVAHCETEKEVVVEKPSLWSKIQTFVAGMLVALMILTCYWLIKKIR